MFYYSSLKANSYRGYTYLYYHLCLYLRRDNTLGTYIALFLPLLALAFIGVIPVLSLDALTYLWTSISIGVLLVGILTLLSFSLLIQAAMAVRQPISIVFELAARILCYVPRPYTNIDGLSYRDVLQLRKIAEVEQATATWRTGFITFIVIGTAAAAISAAAYISQQVAKTNFQVFSETFSKLITTRIFPADRAHAFDPLWLFIGVVVITMVWVTYKFYSYYHDFIVTETANRIILLACEEVISLLDSKGLKEVNEISFEQKSILIEFLGCQLVSRNVVTPFDYRVGVIILNPSNEEWLLIPPTEYSKPARLFYFWRKMIEKIHSSRLFYFLQWIINKIYAGQPTVNETESSLQAITPQQTSATAVEDTVSQPAPHLPLATIAPMPPEIQNKALSVRQPYAEQIMRGTKTIEYHSTHIRGRVYIYASLTPGPETQFRKIKAKPGDFPTGLIIGTVEIVDCTGIKGDYEWHLANPIRLAEPIKPDNHPQPSWFIPFNSES